MNKYLFPAIALALAIASAPVDARNKPTRSGSGLMMPKANGGGIAAGSETTTGTRGGVTRRGQASSDGQGNVRGSSSAVYTGANGGSGNRSGRFQRNADGSFSRSGNASGVGANGGTGTTSGSIAGDGQGNVNGSRRTSLHGANGGSYNGQTTGAAGSGITHTSDGTTASGTNYDASTTVTQEGAQHNATCTNAAGEAVACRK